MVKRVNRKSTNNGNNSSVATVKNIVKKTIMATKTLKWYQDDSGNGSFSTSGVIHSPSLLISQGTTALQRVGAAVLLKNIHFRCAFLLGDATNIMRLTVFKWIPSNTSDAASIGEIFDSSGTGGLTCLAPFLLYSPSRFKILYDKFWELDVYHPTKTLEFDVPLNFRTEFDIGVNTGRNHIYYCVSSDSGGVPHPNYDICTQLSWVDLD